MIPQEELKKFRWLLFLLVPLFAISMNLLLFGTAVLKNGRILVLSTLLLLGITVLLSSLHIGFANWMRRLIAREDRLVTRLLLASFCSIPITALFVSGIFFGYDALSLFHYRLSLTQYKWALLTGVICDVIGIAMNEGIYGYSKWKETRLEAEQLSKEKLQTQLNSLLQQINPHFLFNSLNSLSALIPEDTRRAQQFVSSMSKVYRYLLRANETELTTLDEELRFIDSYFDLLQTRFGKGVRLVKNIKDTDLQALLPPLTLQLLIENAVKHNIVSRSAPLLIEINTTGTGLMVRNNLQKKALKVESGKVGLSNISEKYRLLNKSKIEITDGDGFFSVKIPFIYQPPAADK
ncbi:histidine kinase [Niabella sp.]|uniref:sensor histidine kinase n=1 Tax=Niabella sp. TaxID=1962976 RepID=UPI00262B83E8|nr:histidine kinase [Niabella sp.]